MDLAFHNLQWLMCFKTRPNQIIYLIYIKRIWHEITNNG